MKNNRQVRTQPHHKGISNRKTLELDTNNREVLQKITQSVPFTVIYGIDIPRIAGIYIVSDFRGVLYIGQASDLRRRFYEHLQSCHNEFLNKATLQPIGEVRFSWTDIPNKIQRSTTEKHLVQAFLPPCNKILFNN